MFMKKNICIDCKDRIGKKKSPKKKLYEKCLALAKEIVKLRDNYTCQYCHTPVTGHNCHASHVHNVGRSKKLAIQTINMKVLCYYHHYHWWGATPLESAKWFNDTFPERARRIDELKLEDPKMSMTYLQNRYEELQEEMKQYQDNTSLDIADLPF